MSTTCETVGQRVYLRDLPFAAKDAAKKIGCKWDAGQRAWWIGRAKVADAEKLAADVNAGGVKPAAPGDDSRVYAKVSYKERNYFVIAQGNGRCRLTTLDGGVDFWADMSACELLRTYAPRKRTFRGRTETSYTTLGSLRSFVDSQRRAEARGEEVCGCGCGVRGRLIRDLEDGLMKRPQCCDIPSE